MFSGSVFSLGFLLVEYGMDTASTWGRSRDETDYLGGETMKAYLNQGWLVSVEPVPQLTYEAVEVEAASKDGCNFQARIGGVWYCCQYSVFTSFRSLEFFGCTPGLVRVVEEVGY